MNARQWSGLLGMVRALEPCEACGSLVWVQPVIEGEGEAAAFVGARRECRECGMGETVAFQPEVNDGASQGR